MESQLADLLRIWHRDHLEQMAESRVSAKRVRDLIQEAREAGATNQEIGDVLGVTRQRVSQILRKDSK